MSFQTKSSALLILDKLHHDLILHLCDFLDAASILNFSLTCKKSHQLINENESYWKLRYYREFALDEDWREGAWLSRYSGQTEPKQLAPTLQPKTLKQKATRDWSHIHWRKAYYQRCMLNRHLINNSWYEYHYDLPVNNLETASLCIRAMNAWATLIGENDSSRTWIVQHDTALPGFEPGQFTWNELPQPTNIIGEIISIFDIKMTSCYIVMQCIIQSPEKDDQSSLKDIYERKAIIAWDIQNINRMMPLYVQQDDEARNKAPLPELMDFYGDWVLGSIRIASDSQPNNISYKYFIYNLKRASYHSIGSTYTSSHAYIQSATEYYAQVIILYFNSDDMIVRDESLTMTYGKPTGLRLHWQSYIFDDEHDVGLEDHGGEIIMPYYNNPAIEGRLYGPGLSLIIIFDAEDIDLHDGATGPHAMMALVRVPDHSQPQNSISRRRRACCSGVIGEVLWIQPIATVIFLTLYSQDLIMIRQERKYDILSGTSGKIVFQIDCTTYGLFAPIIGPYCYFLDCASGDGFITNIETGEKIRHSNKIWPPKRRCSVASVEGAHVTGNEGTVEGTSTAKDAGAQDASMTEGDNLMEVLHLLDGTTLEMLTINETNEADGMNDYSALVASSNADTTVEDHLSTDQPSRSLISSSSWPFCNVLGELVIHEPRHRNRLYIYRLYGF